MKKFLLLAVLIYAALDGSEIGSNLKNQYSIQKPLDIRFRTSYEQVPLPQKDKMGMLGTHVDIFPFDSFKQFYVGLGFYSSITGKEGGFFSYGYTFGLNQEIYDKLAVDAGTYFGGGSGDYIGFDGGGMVLHNHLTLTYDLDIFDLALGVARTDFPNSTVNKDMASDTHMYFGINIRDNIWSEVGTTGDNKQFQAFDGLFADIRVSPAVIYYDIDNKPTKRADKFNGTKRYQKNFPLLGMQVEKFLNDEFFISFEGYGALSSAAGYAALQAGVGYDYKLLDSLTWESKIVTGSAGDGRIDTGGGLIVQPLTGLRLNFSPSFSVKALAGRTYAPTGLFSTTTYEFGISWQDSRPVVKNGTYLFDSKLFDQLSWNVSPSLKFYMPYDSSHKTTPEASKQEIGLVGVIVGIPLNEYISVTASTHWAATGNVGEYAEGFLGVKLSSPKFTPLDVKAILHPEIGAGAGDGINQSGGYAAQLIGGLEIPVYKNTSIEFLAGRTKTSDGRFKANTLALVLDIELNSLSKK